MRSRLMNQRGWCKCSKQLSTSGASCFYKQQRKELAALLALVIKFGVVRGAGSNSRGLSASSQLFSMPAGSQTAAPAGRLLLKLMLVRPEAAVRWSS